MLSFRLSEVLFALNRKQEAMNELEVAIAIGIPMTIEKDVDQLRLQIKSTL